MEFTSAQWFLFQKRLEAKGRKGSSGFVRLLECDQRFPNPQAAMVYREVVDETISSDIHASKSDLGE